MSHSSSQSPSKRRRKEELYEITTIIKATGFDMFTTLLLLTLIKGLKWCSRCYAKYLNRKKGILIEYMHGLIHSAVHIKCSYIQSALAQILKAHKTGLENNGVKTQTLHSLCGFEIKTIQISSWAELYNNTERSLFRKLFVHLLPMFVGHWGRAWTVIIDAHSSEKHF